MGASTMLFVQTVLFATAPLIAMTNPVAEVPLFLGLVQDTSPRGVHRAALKVAFGVWIILAIAAIGGLQLLGLLGIEVAAFRAAGGLLLVVMGLEMLQGREPEAHGAQRDSDEEEDALWVPLVMPLLAGPGAIVTTVTLAVREVYFVWWVPVATMVAIAMTALVVYVVLALGGYVAARLHGRGTRIVTRFSGLILVAIGFQMGFTGVEEFFGLGSGT
ncbi:MAG TPA: MarC family protein [Longimicrobiales bacterium]|nr:MarC family protein [Longimicrobiales bacterium]